MVDVELDPTKLNEVAAAQGKVTEATVQGSNAARVLNEEQRKSIEFHAAAIQLYQQQQNELNGTAAKTTLVTQAFHEASEGGNDFNQTLKNLGMEGGFANSVLDRFNKVGEESTTMLGKLSNRFMENSEAAKIVTTSLAALSTQAFVAKNLLGDLGDGTTVSSKSATNFGQDIDSVTKLLNMFGKNAHIPSEIVAGFGKFYSATENVQQFENSLISLNARFAGFGENGNRLEFIRDMDHGLHSFTETNTNLANSLGLSTQETTKYVSEMMQLPGLYKSIIPDAMNTGQTMSAMEAAIRTARGTTGDFKDAFEGMTLQFREFGDRSGKKGLDVLSQTYAVSQELGVSFNDIKGPVSDITKEFAAMGENTESTIKLVEGLGGALLGIKGVGVDTMQKITSEVANSIDKMDIAQKAFLSAQTGGSGGLQGAYQIDMLMRQGKLEEVYQKMEQTLRQNMGGRLVSLEDASNNQEAAAQMTKQLAFMRQGPFGSVVKSDAEAYRLLESFSSGTKPTSDVTSTALSGAGQADQAIQNRQANSLQIISNNIELAKQDLNQINSNTFRSATAAEGTAVGSNQKSYASSVMDNLVTGGGGAYYSPTMAAADDLMKINTLPSSQGVLGSIGSNIKQTMSNEMVPESFDRAPKIPMTVRNARTGQATQGNEMTIKVEGILRDTSGNVVGTIEQSSGNDVNEARTGL